jgi:hypothetical protein
MEEIKMFQELTNDSVTFVGRTTNTNSKEVYNLERAMIAFSREIHEGDDKDVDNPEPKENPVEDEDMIHSNKKSDWDSKED